jgi:hypothetical protein
MPTELLSVSRSGVPRELSPQSWIRDHLTDAQIGLIL